MRAEPRKVDRSVFSRGTFAAATPFPGVMNLRRERAMNNNGLAMIVGGLVVVVAVLLYFGTGMFGGHAEKDINVTIEAPAAPSGN